MNDNFVEILLFHTFSLYNSKMFANILDSFEFQKFQAHSVKAMANDKKINIAVTYFVNSLCTFPYLITLGITPPLCI